MPHADAQAEALRIRARFEAVLAAAVSMSQEHQLAAVLQRIVDVARDVVGARYAALGVLADDGAALVEFVTAGMDAATRAGIGALPRGHGLLGALIRDPQPLRSIDINQHPLRYGFPPNHPPMKSFLGVPIVGRTTVFGNLYLTEKIDGAEFSPEDEQIAVLLSAHAAAAIENARLFEESQRLVAQIQGMQRQRDLFFAMMNHELRNALTGVFGWAEMLVRGKPPESVTPAAREVYDAAERTIELLNNFLDLTRLDAGKVRPVIREIDTAVVVERACAAVRPTAGAKGVTLDVVVANPPPSLGTDRVRLEQMLINLLSNAIRHTPADSLVAVAVRITAPGVVEFRVTDQGPGVPADLGDRIFEPFERFDPHSGLGTGLGLPVSRRLAEVLGGTLEIDRATPVSTFVLTLPDQRPA